MVDPIVEEMPTIADTSPEEIPEAFPFPHPMTVYTGLVADGEGRTWVLLRIRHASGEFTGFFNSEFASQVGGMLNEAAAQVPKSSGLIVPPSGLTRAVPTSLPKGTPQQGPPLNRAARRRQQRGSR